MDRFEAIYRRRSVRKYSDERLSSTVLNEIKEKIKNIEPLYKNIDSKIILAEDGEAIQETFSGLKSKIARVDAPHYLIGVSDDEDRYLENMGYMLEDAVLYLTEKGIGTCWLGSGIEHDLLKDLFDYEGNTVILAAFGDSVPDKSNLRKNPESASRKDLDDLMINGYEVPKEVRNIIDGARMAPSAINSQPWRFFYEDDVIHVYIEKKGMFKKMVRKIGDLDKLNHIDVGIALKHLEIGALNYSKKIRFQDQGRKRKGYEYITSAHLE
ncbi:MAG: nitroreductase family protein [Candidatus Natronoplasma sp.]